MLIGNPSNLKFNIDNIQSIKKIYLCLLSLHEKFLNFNENKGNSAKSKKLNMKVTTTKTFHRFQIRI